MDYVNRFKEFVNSLEGHTPCSATEPPGVVELYNIHKRSLPVGVDRIVAFNLSREEANSWIDIFKTKTLHEKGDKTIIYFDIVKSDVPPMERSVYYNSRPVMEECK